MTQHIIVYHISDLHIKNSRQTEYKTVFEQLANAIKNDVINSTWEKICVIVGDVFDKGHITGNSMQLFLFLIQLLSQVCSKIISIPGNFDKDMLNSIYQTSNMFSQNADIQYHLNGNRSYVHIDQNGCYAYKFLEFTYGSPKQNTHKKRILLLYQNGVSPVIINSNTAQHFFAIMGGGKHEYESIEEYGSTTKFVYSGALIQQNKNESFIKGYVRWDISETQIDYKFCPVANAYGFIKFDIYKNNVTIDKKVALAAPWSHPAEDQQTFSNGNDIAIPSNPYKIYIEIHEEGSEINLLEQIVQTAKEKYKCAPKIIAKYNSGSRLSTSGTCEDRNERAKQNKTYDKQLIDVLNQSKFKNIIPEVVQFANKYICNTNSQQISNSLLTHSGNTNTTWKLKSMHWANMFNYDEGELVMPTDISNELPCIISIEGKNAIGKSAIFKLLDYVLFNVGNYRNISHSAYVKATYEYDNQIYTIHRKMHVDTDRGMLKEEIFHSAWSNLKPCAKNKIYNKMKTIHGIHRILPSMQYNANHKLHARCMRRVCQTPRYQLLCALKKINCELNAKRNGCHGMVDHAVSTIQSKLNQIRFIIVNCEKKISDYEQSHPAKHPREGDLEAEPSDTVVQSGVISQIIQCINEWNPLVSPTIPKIPLTSEIGNINKHANFDKTNKDLISVHEQYIDRLLNTQQYDPKRLIEELQSELNGRSSQIVQEQLNKTIETRVGGLYHCLHKQLQFDSARCVKCSNNQKYTQKIDKSINRNLMFGSLWAQKDEVRNLEELINVLKARTADHDVCQLAQSVDKHQLTNSDKQSVANKCQLIAKLEKIHVEYTKYQQQQTYLNKCKQLELHYKKQLEHIYSVKKLNTEKENIIKQIKVFDAYIYASKKLIKQQENSNTIDTINKFLIPFDFCISGNAAVDSYSETQKFIISFIEQYICLTSNYMIVDSEIDKLDSEWTKKFISLVHSMFESKKQLEFVFVVATNNKTFIKAIQNKLTITASSIVWTFKEKKAKSEKNKSREILDDQARSTQLERSSDQIDTFACEKCKYHTTNKKRYDKHLQSKKHIKLHPSEPSQYLAGQGVLSHTPNSNDSEIS